MHPISLSVSYLPRTRVLSIATGYTVGWGFGSCFLAMTTLVAEVVLDLNEAFVVLSKSAVEVPDC